MSASPVILVDGSSYFFRAFHALPPLTNEAGLPTGAIYGVANMVRRLIKDFSPEQMVVVFDTKGPTFREALFPAYKAHRPTMPDELSVQFAPLINLLELMGLPVLMIEGVEADDVIGSLACRAVEQGKDVLISTGDKDFSQLVNEKITLLNTMTNQSLDIAGVKEKFGVFPTQIIDYLTLIGDSVDNVPGVPKCGPKTAAKWLAEYESLDNLMTHADKISGKIGESLRASLPMLPLSKQLVTIKTDVDLSFELDEAHLKTPQKELGDCLRQLGFKSWLKEWLATNDTNNTPSDNMRYEIIRDKSAWQTYLKRLQSQNVICFDTETTSLDPLTAELVGISFSFDAHDAVYVPLKHLESTPQLDLQDVLNDLKPLLESEMILKIGQNLKYDYAVLKQHGIEVKGLAYDTMLESYVLNSQSSRHDMNTLSVKYLEYTPQSYDELTKQGKEQISFDAVSIEHAAFYAAEDAMVTFRLHEKLYPMLSEGQQRVFSQVEMPLVPVLSDMELTGIYIDKNILLSQGAALKKRIKLLEDEAVQLAGRPFNLQSPAQLQTILFEEHQLPVIEKTPKGQPSTAESALQSLAYTFRLPAVILEYRKLSKLVSTYIDALPKRIHPLTQRVHTSFNQAVTVTGRLSSSEPNLQNIPIRTEEGKAIRQAFVAPPGHRLVSADYSQIELRIMAHLSQDQGLLEAFHRGLDIHAATAAEIFGMRIEDVTHEERRRAKAVNFGLIYGMSAFGLAKQLGIERHEAEKYVKTYFERYPGVLAYMERTRAFASECGYVETLMGRRLYLPEINTRNMIRKKAAERMAINAPMQGTSAELIKLAMIHLWSWQKHETNGRVKMILQVHDELLFEVASDYVETASLMIREKMTQAMALSLPIEVSVGVGDNWADAHS